MTLQQVADFATDPWILTVPTLYVVLFVLLGIKMNYLGSHMAWMRGVTAAGFLYAVAWGLIQGPRPFSRIFQATGQGFDYTWGSVFDAVLILAGIVLVWYSVTRLMRHERLQWLALIIAGYHVGIVLHIALYRGRPVLELFS